MKTKLEYPFPVYTTDDKIFDNISLFNLSFDTKVHYFKNHSNGFSELLLVVFGLGLRFMWSDEN
jgi:hypothetical protein